MTPASPAAADLPTGAPELVSGSVEAVTEEKARKVLERVDFLTKLREEVVVREDLAEVLEEHAQLALDLPEWWQPGKHDHDLVIGAARHGLARMEYYILNDIELSFKDVLKKSLSGEPLADKKALEEWEKKRNEKEMTKKSPDLNGDSAEEIKADKEELAKAKAKAVERSSIVAPQLNLAQMEAAIAKGGGLGYDQEMINDLMAQTYAASVRWPK